MKLNGLDLNKLHVFSSVVKHGGYAGASEELQLTRSALSQSITSLEGSLGVALFYRIGRRIVPTPAALRFYEEARNYQNQLQASLESLMGQKGRAQGTLKIGAYLEFAKSKMMPVIEDFLERNPQAQIKFVFDAPSRLESLLESQRIDLSISVFPSRAKKISSRKLYQEELILVGSPALITERPKAPSFQGVPIIDYYPNHVAFKRWWTLHFGAKIFRSPIRCYAATADMVLEMVRRGLGIGVVPRYVYEATDAAKQVHVIQPTERRLYDYLWINEPSRGQKSMVHQAFSSLLTSRFEPL